jgi:hypothetical protein
MFENEIHPDDQTMAEVARDHVSAGLNLKKAVAEIDPSWCYGPEIEGWDTRPDETYIVYSFEEWYQFSDGSLIDPFGDVVIEEEDLSDMAHELSAEPYMG